MTKKYLHLAGLVAAALFTSLPLLGDVLPNQSVKVASAILGFAVALLVKLDQLGGAPPPAVLLLLVVGLGAACPHPPPTPITPGKVINCLTQAVEQNAPTLVPLVNQCLQGGDVEACLLGLVKPGIGVGIDVIDCVVRHEGAAAEHASRANPADTRDIRIAANAKAFLDKQGVEFAP